MSVYISGAINSGDPTPETLHERKMLFHLVEQNLRRYVTVHNPLRIEACTSQDCNGDQDPEARLMEAIGSRSATLPYLHSWECYMRYDLMAILDDPECVTIVMLPNWQESRGANVEITLARGLGWAIYLVEFDDTGRILFTHLEGDKTL